MNRFISEVWSDLIYTIWDGDILRGEKWERQTATILSSLQQKAMRSDIDRDEAINERWVDNLRAWALFLSLNLSSSTFQV